MHQDKHSKVCFVITESMHVKVRSLAILKLSVDRGDHATCNTPGDGDQHLT
jgi:hypothetical protein